MKARCRETLAEFSVNYHSDRKHQGKGNKLLLPDAGCTTKQPGHAVECHQRLGALLKFYGRAAMNCLSIRGYDPFSSRSFGDLTHSVRRGIS